MPLLEVSQNKKVSASIHLTETAATQLDQYAAFIHTSADSVIEEALGYVFAKDKEFQEFLKSPDAAKVSPTLRVRKTPQAPQPVQAADGVRKPVAASSTPQNGGARLSEVRA